MNILWVSNVIDDNFFPSSSLNVEYGLFILNAEKKVSFCFNPTLQDDDQESIVMPNKNGENYLCFLPKVEKAKSEMPLTQLNVSSMIVETEKRVKLKTPDELLEALKGLCFVRVSIYYQKPFCTCSC